MEQRFSCTFLSVQNYITTFPVFLHFEHSPGSLGTMLDQLGTLKNSLQRPNIASVFLQLSLQVLLS